MEELLKQLLEMLEKNCQRHKIIIIETSGNLYHDKVVDVLKNHYDQLSLSIWNSTEYGSQPNKRWDNGKIITSLTELMVEIKDADLVLIPSLSRELLVKGALCMSDTSSSHALQLALMQRKMIMALDSEVNLKLDHWKLQKLDANEAYIQNLLLFRNKLIDFGVQFVTIIEFPDLFKQWLSECSSVRKDNRITEKHQCASASKTKIITYQDVVGQDELVLPDDAKLTELAQDYVQGKAISNKLTK